MCVNKHRSISIGWRFSSYLTRFAPCALIKSVLFNINRLRYLLMSKFNCRGSQSRCKPARGHTSDILQRSLPFSLISGSWETYAQVRIEYRWNKLCEVGPSFPYWKSSNSHYHSFGDRLLVFDGTFLINAKVKII